ncbi:MAG: hypothetical protein WA705_12670 [Candidatus Ozemobacteraceae bacterium]
MPLPILQSYVGKYSITLEGHALQVEVYLAGNTPMMRTSFRGTGSRSDLYPTASDTFLLKDDPIVPGSQSGVHVYLCWKSGELHDCPTGDKGLTKNI